MFDLDITLAFQLVNFAVTLVVLNFLLIRPIRDIVKKRRDLASGMLSDTEIFSNDAVGKLERYEAALVKAREEAAAAREAHRKEGASREAVLLEAAHNDAQAFILSARESTRKAVAETKAAMEKRVPELASMAVARLIGNPKRPVV